MRIADSRGGSGVYASMDPAPLKHFLALAGHHEETITNNTALLTKILNGGESVFVDYAGTDRFYSLTMGKMGAAERLALGLCLDMNLASSADWDLLPGIGKKTAEKIVAQREKLGALRSADDLLAVKGIGAKKLAQISPHLCEGQGR